MDNQHSCQFRIALFKITDSNDKFKKYNILLRSLYVLWCSAIYSTDYSTYVWNNDWTDTDFFEFSKYIYNNYNS